MRTFTRSSRDLARPGGMLPRVPQPSDNPPLPPRLKAPADARDGLWGRRLPAALRARAGVEARAWRRLMHALVLLADQDEVVALARRILASERAKEVARAGR